MDKITFLALTQVMDKVDHASLDEYERDAFTRVANWMMKEERDARRFDARGNPRG